MNHLFIIIRGHGDIKLYMYIRHFMDSTDNNGYLNGKYIKITFIPQPPP